MSKIQIKKQNFKNVLPGQYIVFVEDDEFYKGGFWLVINCVEYSWNSALKSPGYYEALEFIGDKWEFTRIAKHEDGSLSQYRKKIDPSSLTKLKSINYFNTESKTWESMNIETIKHIVYWQNLPDISIYQK